MTRGLVLVGLLVAAIGAALWFSLLQDPEAPTDAQRAETGAPPPRTVERSQEASPAPETGAPTTQAGSDPAGDSRSAISQPSETESAQTGDREAAPEPTDGAPSFDVVRVERDGSSVMAGRARPNSEVVVTRNGEEVARGRADGRGEFVLLPEQALPPGDYALELEATTADGVTQTGDNVVVLSVPETGAATEAAGSAQPEGEAGPLVVQLPAETAGAARVLQVPEAAPTEVTGGLWLEAIDYDAAGRLVISGQGLPGGRIVVYLDNTLLSEAAVGEDGLWRVTPGEAVAPGLYTLRVDQLDAAGAVTARVESPFARAAFESADLPADERFVVIQPGNNLWTIASRTYGAGPRYTVIFEANADQIRDPDLIYPGQIFVLPSQDGAG